MDISDLKNKVSCLRQQTKELSSDKLHKWEDFRKYDDVHSKLVILERELAKVEGNQFVVPLQWQFPWGNPNCKVEVFDSLWSVLAVYTPCVVDKTQTSSYNKSDVIIIKFHKSESTLIENINDEIWPHVTLLQSGFDGVGLYLVENSKWKDKVKQSFMGHHQFDNEHWTGIRHYLCVFRERMVHCLAQDISPIGPFPNLDDAINYAINAMSEQDYI